MCRLCEFANVRCMAVQFVARWKIFIALELTFANYH